MKLKMFSIFDSKVKAYMNPFTARQAGEALRSFEQAVSDPQTQFHKFPADFTLFEIGSYDEDTGTLHPLEAKIALATALEVKSNQEKQH